MTLRSYPSRSNVHSAPGSNPVTKRLTLFNQIILVVIALAVLMLISANLLMHHEQNSSKVSPSNQLGKHREYSQAILHQNLNIPFERPTTNFEHMQEFQRQHVQFQHETLHSSESLDEPGNFLVEHPLPVAASEGGQVFTGDTLDQTSTDGQSQTFLDSSNTQFSVLSESSLPTFSNDYSEFLFNSLIEIANEHHTKYYLTTQLLSHYNLRPSEIKRLKILKSHKLIWENALNQFQSVKYYPNGKRRERPYLFCRISYPKWDHTRHSWYVFEETIAADFIPNRLTSHPSVNKRIDVMRCPLNETDYQSFLHLLGGEPPSSNVEQDTATQLQNRRLRELFWSEKNADSHQQHPMMRVEILKEDKPIIHYSIDLRTRMTGYLMDFVDPSTFPVVDHPIPNSPDSSSLQSLTASLPSSRLSMWPAVEYDNNYHYHLFNFSPKIFLCVPQIIKPLSKNNIVLFLEFISHHLNIGVEHIFFPTIWSKDSPHYQRFKQLLISYINEGKVSIISQASNYKDDELINNQEADGVKSSDNNNKDQLKYSDIPFEFYGILWDKFFLKTLQSNTLLYLSKGIADYILYLDIDQFFIPKLPQHQPGLAKHFKTNQFLPTLILKAIYSSELLNYGPDLLMKLKEGEGDQWKGGAGWADQHHHPLCYLAVGSEAMLPVKGPKQYDRNWLGLLFHHGSEKAHNDSSIQKKLQQDRIILPTHHIYYTGSYHPGACRLSWQFNGCHNPNTGFCFDPSKSSTLPSSLSHADSMSGPVLDHRFDETVTPADSKHLNPDEDAVIYHYSYYDRRVSASAASIKQDNLYTSYYFPLVYQDLARRGLALLIDLPDSVPEAILGKNKQLNITILSSKDVIDYDVKMENDDLEGKSSQSPEEVLTDFKLHIPKAELTSLPSFATDLSEIILHSLIERGQQSYDLSVTTFLVNHQFIHTFGKRINPSSATSSKEDASSVSHQIDVQSFLSTWNGFEAIHPNVVPYWQEILSKFEETVYVENQGIRMTKPSKQKPMDVANRQKFQCRIRNMVTSSSSSSSPSSEGDAEYLVDGIFVPHYFTSEEEESIIQVDILRCPLGNTQFLYRKYANSEEEINIQVEIIKNDLSIIHFVIPWKERNTGLMSFPSSTYSYDHWEHHLFHQDEENQSHEGGNTPTHQMHHGHHVGGSSAEEEDDHETEFLVSSSREMSSRTIGLQYKQEALLAEISALTPVTLEAWKGVSPTSGYGTMDKVYVALIMEEEDPTPRLLEFLEYYLTILQVDHVIIASPFSWISGEMKGLLRSLQPYLIDKKVSIISMMDPSYHTSAADVDETSSVIVKSNFLLGAILAKQSVHHMFQNICLYYLKGLVEVFSAVKLSDFIVPVTSLQTIIPQNLNAKPQNHLQQLLQQSFLDDKKDIKNTCLIKIPRKTLIQVYGEDIIADTQENDRLFRFLPYTSSSSASKNKNVSIVQLTNDYSSAESFLIPTNNIFYISTVNAGGNRKSDETSQSLKASRVYACKVPFPYHGCNDRRTFCLKEDETNHSPAIESLTPVYFDDRNINEDYILTVKEESLTLYHMTEKTASQLNEDQELITTAFTDNNMLELFSSKRSPSRSGDSILTTPITQALISKNRFLPFLLPDSLSNSDIRLLTQQYQRKLVSSFANALHVKYQMEDSRVEEVLETLPAMTRDKETLIISSMWETTSPLIIAETEMISVVHLVISSESSYWTDFSSIEARSPSPDSASATPAWQSYQCKVIISPFDKVITSQTIYEELADGIGLIRCLITLPKDILSATPPEQLLVAKPNSFKVALVKPLSKGVFSRLRGGVNGELDDAGTVLKYELTDHTLGKGLLFPLPLSSKQNNKEAVEVEKKYNQLFHPVNSILKSPLPSIVPKEKSETALNLCFSVPWENLMNKQTLSLLVESLLHHYHLGIHHIFLSIRLYSLSTNEDDYNDRLLYLQALKPFLQKQQLTIFFISSPIPSTKNAPTPSEANSQALSSQMLHHFEFLQQYTMTLALLLSRGQGVRLLSYWKTHQLLILPPLFDPLQWKEYHAHHQGHHNESNIKENSNKVEQGVKIGFDGIEMDANKVSDVIGKKRNTIEEFIDKMIKLSKKEKEDIQKEEKYYFLHSLPIPSRELTNHLLFLQKEGKGGVGSSSSNNANTNKQFLGDTYQLSPNYYHYYFHYYSKRFFQNNYNNNYANYLNNFLYDHYHNNLIQDDPTMPSFDFGFILHLPSITPPSTSTSSNENKVGGGVVSSSTSPFLQFLWYNYLPTSYKGKKLNKNFLLRMNTNIIHFTIAELYSYYDYQNIYNLQQILVKNLNNPLQSLTMNKKNDRRRVRLLRRKLQTIEELTIKDQHDHNLINDLLLVNGNELLRNAEEEAANEFAEEEKQRASGRINNNNNDGNNGNGFQEFFSNLVSKIRKSDSSPSEIEKELSSIQSNLHGRDEIEEDAGTSSSTTVTTSANNNNNNNNKGRTNSFQTIFSYYQRKDQSFTNKLFFIYFLNVHSLPLPINTTDNINQRYEIVIERDHEKNQLIMKQRAEIIEGYDTSMYYEEFVKNKVDINTFLIEEVSHDLNSNNPHQKEGEEVGKRGNNNNKEEDMKTIRDHRTLEEYYRLLQRNIYSYEYYPSLLFESSSSSSSSSSSLSSLNLLKENYDILFQQNPIQKIIMSKEEKQRKNKAMKTSSSSFNSQFPDFLTVYKTRFSHE